MSRRPPTLPPPPSDLLTTSGSASQPAGVREQLQSQVTALYANLASLSSLLQNPSSLENHAVSSQKRARVLADDEPPASAAGSADTTANSAEWGGDCADMDHVRKRLRGFAVDRNWDQFHHPRNLCLALVGEVGELAECFQWKGDTGAATGLPDWTAEKRVHLGEELADVALYLIRLADKCDVDLPAAIGRKLQKNADKYPAKLVYGSSKKYNEYT